MNFRRAFSLIELMIVIMIIGVVYTLAITKFQTIKEGGTEVSLVNLKRYLLSVPKQVGIDDFENVRFLCLDDCKSCDVFVDNQKVSQDGSFDGFIDSSIRTYRYDFTQGMLEAEPKVFFNIENIEESVCFSYEISRNGVGDQVLIEYKDKVYDYSSYLDESTVYSSLSDVSDMKEDKIQEVIR